MLPSILEYRKRFGKNPQTLITAFAALIKFYRTDMSNDDAEIMEFMKTASLEEILKRTDYWGGDLSFLYDALEKEVNAL